MLVNKKLLFVSLLALSFLAAACDKQASKDLSGQLDKDKEQKEMMENKKMMKESEEMMGSDKITGIFMRDGKLLTVWPGNDLEMLEHDVTLKTGIKVMLNGTITKPDGSHIALKNGQVMHLDGTVTQANQDLMKKKAMMGAGETTMDNGQKVMEGKKLTDEKKPGSYQDFSPEILASEQKAGHKVVLFFHAKWCPFCKTADAAFSSRTQDIPSGVTVLKTDYDSEKTLKTKYGVTYQHTFVQVDANGNMVTKWNGGDIDALKANIK
ncbi:MAG: redoxin domain-containing protein [Candidatus Doudnabacteria bacterium]|nr:redoxin domain-containing protein [Candidatus Doudnabacteria bacterium]